MRIRQTLPDLEKVLEYITIKNKELIQYQNIFISYMTCRISGSFTNKPFEIDSIKWMSLHADGYFKSNISVFEICI